MIPMDLDIRLLRMFATLARVGSKTRTGEILNLTQSAVSHGMKRLESQLGCALIYQKGKTAHLTPEGRHFLGQVLRSLDGLDRAAESITGRGEMRAKLTVVLSAAMAQEILAPVLREFRESYPNVSVAVRLEDSPAAIAEIEEGRADLAIAISTNLSPGLKAHALFKDELYFLHSALHPWAEKTSLTASDLKDQHYLLYTRNSETFRRTEEYFLHNGIRLSSYVEIPSFEIMKQLARLGLGIAIMAPWVASKELGEGSLIAQSPPRARISRQWVVVHQGSRQIRQAEQTFIGLCRMATSALAR